MLQAVFRKFVRKVLTIIMRGRSKILVPAAAACVAGICSPQVFAQKASGQLVPGTPSGLRADYFANAKLSGKPQVSRVDTTVNFWWMGQAADPKVGKDNFSVRWSGQVQAPVSGPFTFAAYSDEGIRVTVDGRRVLDHWDGHQVKHDIGTPITLEAGKWYPITVEYYEVKGDAVVHLLWSYPGRASQTVPQQYLSPDSSRPEEIPAGVPLAPPTNVRAFGIWDIGAPAIDVSGEPVQGALNYRVYRGGTLLASGLTSPRFRDTSVRSGELHAYRMSAIGSDGEESAQSDPAATATAPFPPTQVVTKFGAPTNLSVKGLWNNGSTDQLSWIPVADAAGYNVYQYDMLVARGVKDPTFTLPANLFIRGMTYNVTAIDSSGMESLPSNIVGTQGANDPASAPSWRPGVPTDLGGVTVTPEWNNEKPRFHVRWNADAGWAQTYTVYRDGVRIAEGLWGLEYVDENVAPGARHAYSVAGTNLNWTTVQEGPRTAEVAAAALSQAPAPAGIPVTIAKIVPNDDSVIVYFNAVPGAVDYVCYKPGVPNVRKYSAGGLSIEMNGIDPASGADLVVEAIDKFGPFQKIDGEPGPGGMQHDGSVRMEINGIGHPSNVPNAIARSSVFHVACSPRSLTGAQAFFDTFRNSAPFKQVFPVDQRYLDWNGGGNNDADNPYVREWQNDKWTIRAYQADVTNSRIFVMSNHFMDTLYDGGTPRSNVPMHNNNASLVMQPKSVADISGGRVLHVTMEVDPHFSNRRWCDIFVAAADDPVIQPGKFAENGMLPTVSGNMFRWEILAEFHTAQIFRGVNGQLTGTGLIDTGWGENSERFTAVNRTYGHFGQPAANGTMANLDRRNRYDLYLSQNRFRIMENGLVIKDAVFPNGETLPFSKVAVYFVHQLYHTNNEHQELLKYNRGETYWINYRPWADERHWDNMGFEVLPAFPTEPVGTVMPLNK